MTQDSSRHVQMPPNTVQRASAAGAPEISRTHHSTPGSPSAGSALSGCGGAFGPPSAVTGEQGGQQALTPQATSPPQSGSQQPAESPTFFTRCKDVKPREARKMKAGDPYDHAKTLWQTMAIVNSLIIGACMSALLAGPPTQQPASSAPALPVVLNITLSAHQDDSAVVSDALQRMVEEVGSMHEDFGAPERVNKVYGYLWAVCIVVNVTAMYTCVLNLGVLLCCRSQRDVMHLLGRRFACDCQECRGGSVEVNGWKPPKGKMSLVFAYTPSVLTVLGALLFVASVCETAFSKYGSDTGWLALGLALVLPGGCTVRALAILFVQSWWMAALDSRGNSKPHDE